MASEKSDKFFRVRPYPRYGISMIYDPYKTMARPWLRKVKRDHMQVISFIMAKVS
ncbi:hypothetical protein F383_12176 [Gossypium arboreum]|uniref:Uncharacterized protein n=1 Tax=Gossypium arboreum TaxID=29729 RepID=A0A0B0PVL7_GOSAR|nr:hypothetical protein F383_12176 [Gossypium arboreum]